MTKKNSIQPSANSQPITVDWDDFVDGNLPGTSHTQRWQQAVVRAAETLPGQVMAHAGSATGSVKASGATRRAWS